MRLFEDRDILKSPSAIKKKREEKNPNRKIFLTLSCPHHAPKQMSSGREDSGINVEMRQWWKNCFPFMYRCRVCENLFLRICMEGKNSQGTWFPNTVRGADTNSKQSRGQGHTWASTTRHQNKTKPGLLRSLRLFTCWRNPCLSTYSSLLLRVLYLIHTFPRVEAQKN